MSRWGLIDSDLENRQKLYFRHYFNQRVPLEPEANRRWRGKDFLFYCAGFLYIFDAGDESGVPGPVPFIPHEFQVECITLAWAALHELRKPLRGKKPRRQGFTWIIIALFEHCWHFMSNRHLLVGSHREEEVDGTMGT